ncbi:MAG: hypothetical protein WA843_00420 [Candidatus Saccharimonadales bacterium]
MARTQDLQPALDAAQNQLGLTFSTSDSLDTKALAILAFDVAILIFVLQSETRNSLWLLVPLFAALSFSLCACLATVRPREYAGAIVDLVKHPDYFALDKQALVAQLLADTQQGIARNSSLNRVKSRYCAGAIVASFLSTILLVGCIL